MSIHETCNKLSPVLFVRCFFNPALERSVHIYCDFRDVCKLKLEIFHDEVLVVEKGSSNLTNLVAARRLNLLSWAIMRSLHYFLNKVKLAGGYHVTYTRYVVEHPPDMFIPDLLLIHPCHCHSQNMLQWRKTSSLFDRAYFIDHVSHPHRGRFIGITQKSRYLLQISR